MERSYTPGGVQRIGPAGPDGSGSATRNFEPVCGLLVEADTLYGEFKRLGLKYGFGGKQAHDARLVAMMLCWGIDKVLTLNARDFRPYSAEGVSVVTPESLTGAK